MAGNENRRRKKIEAKRSVGRKEQQRVNRPSPIVRHGGSYDRRPELAFDGCLRHGWTR